MVDDEAIDEMAWGDGDFCPMAHSSIYHIQFF